MSEQPPRKQIMLTASLDRWFHHSREKGQRFAVFSIELKAQIMAQEGWEQEYYIEQRPEETTLFRIWPLSEWLFHKSNNMELKRENNTANLKAAADYHTGIEQWKLNLRRKLNKMLTPKQVEEMVSACLDPKSEHDYKCRAKIVTKFPMPEKPEGLK